MEKMKLGEKVIIGRKSQINYCKLAHNKKMQGVQKNCNPDFRRYGE